MEKRNEDWRKEITELTKDFNEFLKDEKEFFDAVSVIKDHKSALRFLKKHKTVPSELELMEDDYNLYCDVIKYFSENRGEECISLMVFSIRNWSSLSLAQGFAFALKNQNESIVNKTIKNALLSKDINLKKSGLFFAIELPSIDFIEPLKCLLKGKYFDDEILMDAIEALEIIKEKFNISSVDQILENTLKKSERLQFLIKEKNHIEKVQYEVNRKYNIAKANSAFMEKDYIRVIELLEPYNGELPMIEQKKYDISKKIIAK